MLILILLLLLLLLLFLLLLWERSLARGRGLPKAGGRAGKLGSGGSKPREARDTSRCMSYNAISSRLVSSRLISSHLILIGGASRSRRSRGGLRRGLPTTARRPPASQRTEQRAQSTEHRVQCAECRAQSTEPLRDDSPVHSCQCKYVLTSNGTINFMNIV